MFPSSLPPLSFAWGKFIQRISIAAGSACDAHVKLLGNKIPSSAVALLIKWTPGEPAIPRYWLGCTDLRWEEEAGAQIGPERL